jgi:segregation and condensation protein B
MDERDKDIEIRRAMEAVLFLADEAVPAAALAQILEVSRHQVEAALAKMSDDYEARGSGIVLRNVAGGWRLMTHPDAAPVIQQFILSSRHTRLTKASLETLAVVAYKQPVTRHQISSVRGVDSDGVIRALMERGLIEEVGRDDGPGRPVLYGTSALFLERLGLASLADLPPVTPLLADAGTDRATLPPG